MKNLFFVDCEAVGPCPSMGRLTEFGVVHYATKETFYGNLEGLPEVSREQLAYNLIMWLRVHCKTRPIFVSDNPAYDWQWITDFLWRYGKQNPFGHSARRISDFYAGLCGNFYRTQDWKKMRVTPHDHNPVNDAMGNVEAFERILNGER